MTNTPGTVVSDRAASLRCWSPHWGPLTPAPPPHPFLQRSLIQTGRVPGWVPVPAAAEFAKNRVPNPQPRSWLVLC